MPISILFFLNDSTEDFVENFVTQVVLLQLSPRNLSVAILPMPQRWRKYPHACSGIQRTTNCPAALRCKLLET